MAITAQQKAQIEANALARKQYAGTSQADKAVQSIQTAQQSISDIQNKGTTGDIAQLTSSIKKDTGVVANSLTANQLQQAGLSQRDQQFVGEQVTSGGQIKVWDSATNSYKTQAQPQTQPQAPTLDTSGQSFTKWKESNPQGSYAQWAQAHGGAIDSGFGAAKEAQLARETSTAGIPTPSTPGEKETPEDALRRQLADQKALTDYYTERDKKKGEEMATVSGQVADFGAKLQAFQASNREAIALMNSSMAGLGDRVASSAAELGLTAVSLNDPQIQGQLKAAASKGSIQEQNDAIKAVLTAAGSSSTSPATIASTTTPKASYASLNSTPTTVLDPKVALFNKKTLDQANFNSLPAQDLHSLVDQFTKSGQDLSNFTSDDLDLMQLENAFDFAEESKEEIKANALQRKNRILIQKESFKDQLYDRGKEETDLMTSIKDSQVQQLELREQEIYAEKEATMKDLAGKTERMESFIKAQMEYAGIPLVGQMGFTTLANSLAKWNSSVQATGRGFDEQINEVHNKQVDVLNNYSSKIFEIYSNIQDKDMELTEKANDKMDKIDSDELLNEQQSDLLKFKSLNDLLSTKSADLKKKDEMAFEAQKAQEEQLFELQKEGIKAAGYIPTIGADGRPTYMKDSNGEYIQSVEAQKLYAEMNKMSIQTIKDADGNEQIVLVNPYNGQKTFISDSASHTDSNGYTWGGIDTSNGQTFTVAGTTFKVGDDWAKSGLPGAEKECVGFGRYCAPDLPGNLWTIEDKRAIYGNIPDIGQVEVGDTLFSNSGDIVQSSPSGPIKTGHVMTATSGVYLNGEGRKVIDVIDANYENNKNVSEIKTRTINVEEVDRDPKTGKLGIFRSQNKQIRPDNAQSVNSSSVKFDAATVSEMRGYLDSNGQKFPYYAKTAKQKDSFRKMANEFKESFKEVDIATAIDYSVGGKPVTDTVSESITKSMTVLQNVEDLNTLIDGQDTGPILGIMRGNNPYDVKAQLINAKLKTIVPMLARGVYGEVGVLTNADIENYSKTLPNLKSTNEVNVLLLDMTRNIIKKSTEKRIKNYALLGYDLSGLSGTLDDLNQIDLTYNTNQNTEIDFNEFDDIYSQL